MVSTREGSDTGLKSCNLHKNSTYNLFISTKVLLCQEILFEISYTQKQPVSDPSVSTFNLLQQIIIHNLQGVVNQVRRSLQRVTTYWYFGACTCI